MLAELLMLFERGGRGREGKEGVGHCEMEPATMSQSWGEWGREGQVYPGDLWWDVEFWDSIEGLVRRVIPLLSAKVAWLGGTQKPSWWREPRHLRLKSAK